MSLPIPEATFDQHILVLGKTRSGKSSAMRLLVERLLDEGKPVCIIDPKGDWYGLRTSADRKQPGYPVVIFGGEHADVPVNSRSGVAVAELAATGNRPCIIDLGGWMPGARAEFLIDFLSGFFRFSRGRRWLVIDECHNVAPQGKVLDPQAGKLLHWSNRIASEGLGKGISLIAASQRPQKVHKDFVTSAETLIAMRVIHPLDRNAIRDWIDGCGDPAKGHEVLDTLASNQRGQGWVWSPEIDFGPKRVQFPMFKTFDSFKAQTTEQPAKLKGWADVDLEDVTKKLEAAVKEAEANDPKKLQARVRELQSENAQLKTKVASRDAAMAVPEGRKKGIADKGYVKNVTQLLREEQAYTGSVVKYSQRFIEVLLRYIADIERSVKSLGDTVRGSQRLKEIGNFAPPKRVPSKKAWPLDVEEKIQMVGDGRIEVRLVPTLSGRDIASPNVQIADLTRPQMRVLSALAEFAGIGIKEPTRKMVAAWCGVKATTGSFKNYLSELRTRGLILNHGPDHIVLSAAGQKVAPEVQATPTHEQLLERAVKLFGSTPGNILKLVCKEYPNFVRREMIAAHFEISSETGSFKNYLSGLRSAGMIEDGPEKSVKAAGWLFL